MEITVTVNGAEYTRDVEPRMLLIHFIRDELELTGVSSGGPLARARRTHPTAALRDPVLSPKHRNGRDGAAC